MSPGSCQLLAMAAQTITTGTGEWSKPRDDERDMFGLTHTGKVRKDNQDHFLICTVYPQVVIDVTSLPDAGQLELRGQRLATMGLVADGVGGSDGGSDASRLAAETITRFVASTLRSYHAAGSSNEGEFHKALTDGVMKAHDAVRAEGDKRGDAKRMATTLTLAIGVWPWLYVVQVGDSRAYYHDGTALKRMTTDQTIAQQLVDAGAMPKERLDSSPYKHVLASAIGGEEATPQITRVDLRRHGTTLMCSDGLTRHVTDAEIESHVAKATSSEQLCRDLLALALDRGGHDNVTIIAARYRYDRPAPR